jgi:hypothetical protein
VSSVVQKRYALPGEKIPQLTKSFTRAQVIKITDTLMLKDCPFTFLNVVPTDVEESLLNLFQARHFMNRTLRKECIHWKTWSLDKFVEELKFAVPDTKVSRPHSSQTFYELVARLDVQFDLENDIYEINLDSSLIAIQNKFPDVTPEEELKATKLLISRLPEQPINWQAILFREFKGEVPNIITIEDFRFIFRAQLNRLRDLAQDMRDVGWTLTGSDQTRYLKEKPIRKHPVPNSSIPSDEQPVQKKSSNSTVDTLCTGCGRNNHTVESCHFKTSPYYNSSDVPYRTSQAFVKLRRDYPTNVLAPSGKYIAENPLKVAEKATSSSSSKQTKTKQKGDLFPDSTYFSTISGPEFDTDYLSVTLSHVSQSLEPPRSEIKALLDTGSLAGDFVAYRCILNLKLESFVVTSKKRIVCSGLDNKCYDISKSIQLRIFYFSEILNKTVFIETTAIILESSPVDLILGRNTIKLNNFLTKFLVNFLCKTSIQHREH